MVSTTGWIIGGTALITMIVSIIFGIFFIYKAKKLKAKLLYYAGFIIICSGLFYLGASTTFLSLIITGKNIPNDSGVHGLLTYTSVAPGIICAMYLGSELLVPEKKKIIVSMYAVIGIIFEIFLYINPNASIKFTNEDSSEELIDSSFVLLHPTFIIIVLLLISVFIFCGIGFLIKAQQASGDIKKKYRYISLSFIVFVISAVFDALLSPGIWLIPVRIGMIIYALLLYIGLHPTKTI